MGTGGRRDSQHAIPDHTYDNVAPSSAPSMGPSAAEHYSRAQFASPPQAGIVRSLHDRAQGSGISHYGFQEHPISAHSLQTNFPLQTTQASYSPYLQDSLRSNQMPPPPSHQQYTPYQMDYMLPPVQQSTHYDTTSPYQERRPMSLGTMTNQFSMVPYMPPGEQGSIDVGESSSQFMIVPSNQPVYGTGSISRTQQPSSLTVPSSTYQMLEQHEVQESQHTDQGTAADEQKMQEYERELRGVFDSIVAGRVTEAAEKLLELSRWLLSSVEQLRLHHDDETLHEQRILMWREFNHAWEALGQKQKNIAQDMLTTRQRPADTLTADDVVRIMNEFVALCDKVEQFALVDYELGVWEEQIVGVFIVCLDLLSQHEPAVQGEASTRPR